MAAVVWSQFAPAAAQCFGLSRPTLPTLESVSSTLTNGSAGVEVYRAVADGDTAAVAALIAADPDLLSTRTNLPEGVRPSNGNSSDLLTAAVANCDAAMLETLLGAGATPDGAIPGLALSYAILADTPELAIVLLDAGASPDAHDPSRSTPLHEALVFERADSVALLAARGADVDRADAVGGIPLGVALSGQNWPEVQALIEAGANPWQVYGEGILPAYMIWSSDPAEPGDRAIRDALLERIQIDAPIWPPVNSTELRARFLDGSLPTPEMREGGLIASPEAMEIMRRVGP
jgi:hypothetical protein